MPQNAITELSSDDLSPGRNSRYCSILGPSGLWKAVFFQTSLGEIAVYHWSKDSGKWKTKSVVKDAANDTPLAAVGFENGYVHLFYLKKVSLRFSYIQEIVWTADSHSAGDLNSLNTETYTGSDLGAVNWGTYGTSGQIRLYYQSPDSAAIKELVMSFSSEKEHWLNGKGNFPGVPSLGTPLSFVNTIWSGTHIIRGFWLSHDGYIEEYHWQTAQGWNKSDFTPVLVPKGGRFAATVTVYDKGYKIFLFHVNRSIKKLEWTLDDSKWKDETDVDETRANPDTRLTTVGAFHSNHTIDQDELYLYSSDEDSQIVERVLLSGSWSAPTRIKS